MKIDNSESLIHQFEVYQCISIRKKAIPEKDRLSNDCYCTRKECYKLTIYFINFNIKEIRKLDSLILHDYLSKLLIRENRVDSLLGSLSFT